jgi:hypothetical protein
MAFSPGEKLQGGQYCGGFIMVDGHQNMDTRKWKTENGKQQIL